MPSDVMAIQTAEVAADRPWLQTLHEWVTTVDHKRLGVLYIALALLFLMIGGIEATIIRIQLMRPHSDFVSPQVFNRMFTMHGTTRSRYGVSAVECVQLLAHGSRRISSLLQFCGRKRPLRCGKCAGRRMVGVRAVDVTRIFRGP